MRMRVKEVRSATFLGDHRQTILRHFQVLAKLFFTLYGMDLDVYHQKGNVRVALLFAEWIKTSIICSQNIFVSN